MTEVFVDTWAWYALSDRNDRYHKLAQDTLEHLLAQRYRFVTTNFVLDETLTLIRYHLSHAAAVRFWHLFWDLVNAGLVQFIRIGAAEEQMAWEIFEAHTDQDFSFTDCTSFAVMQSLGLVYVFSADHHFAVMGFVLVPPIP